ncbi:hypothetical protein ILUMI_18135, partial [Ignelater luminosus]
MLKLTNGYNKTEILQQTKRLKGTYILIDEDYPHLKDAKMKEHKALMKYNKLINNGQTYGVQDCTETKLSHAGGANGGTGKRTATERSPEGDNLQNQTVEAITEFYDTLQNSVDEAKGEVIILGDFNGKTRKILGPYGENSISNNGKKLLEFRDLQILGLKKKILKIYQSTTISTGIDYIL